MKHVANSKKSIAKSYVSLGIAGHNFNDPIKWASGTFNPFYVDNRRAISDPAIRTVIRGKMPGLINNIDGIDCVYPIPKAGIAPSTLLALQTKKPLLIEYGGKYHSMDMMAVREFMLNDLTPLMQSADVIAGTSPFGIICGIIVAEELRKPFLFVREKPKDHGLRKQVEGIVRTEDVLVTLIDPIHKEFESYRNDAIHALKTEAQLELVPSIFDRPIDSLLREVNIQGKRIATVEDLVSTGESLINQITGLIEMGATIDPCSVFSYELPSAVENFKKHGLVNKSILDFPDLMLEYGKAISRNDEKDIWEWYHNQANWGDLNGFSSVKK